MNKENILEVKQLHKRFTSKNITVKAVTDVSFTVKEGETTVMTGSVNADGSITWKNSADEAKNYLEYTLADVGVANKHTYTIILLQLFI